MALDQETRALIERLSSNVERVGRETTRAIERVDQTIKDHDAVETKVDRMNSKQT